MTTTALLFVSDDASVFLLDLPRSIELAQMNSPESHCPYQIISSEPRLVPYPSTDPKTPQKRKEFLSKISVAEQVYHQSLQQSIYEALTQIRCGHEGPWCRTRHTVENAYNKKFTGSDQSVRPKLCNRSTPGAPIILSGPSGGCDEVPSLQNYAVTNVFARSARLKMDNKSFSIPPHSTFILSDISNAQTFSHSARLLIPQRGHAISGSFDLIVLDPPWSNRSVRRSKNYITSEDQSRDPFNSVHFLFVHHLSVGGIVALWITNKWKVRENVLHTLAKNGLILVEEWIWAKVTVAGEPVSDVTGLWRHPYEVCLVFQKMNSSEPRERKAKRRILAAVPDFHSRKPKLMELFFKVFPSLTFDYALEVFARDLCAGWWSWGDDVLKYANRTAWNIPPESVPSR